MDTWEAVLCAGEHGLVGGGESPVPGRAELPPRPQGGAQESAFYQEPQAIQMPGIFQPTL